MQRLSDAEMAILQAACDAVEPDAELHLEEWSEENVVLPKGSAFAGDYTLRHTPYARRILQVLSPTHQAAVVVCMIASQMLKTQVFINAAMGWIDRAPANILALEPNDGLAKRLSARVGKSIAACKALKGKVAEPRSRDSRNTVNCKEFDGGAIYITTAGSEANLAEIPARYLFCDEVDREGWKPATEGEGCKVALAMKRLTTYEGISKAYIVSSPTFDGDSKVHDFYSQGTQEAYHVPCPHCGHLHELLQQSFDYDVEEATGRVLRAVFICPDCGAEIEEHHKKHFLLDEPLGGTARWVADAPGDGLTFSFRLNAFYAPLGSVSWFTLAKEHWEATRAKERGDDSLWKVYVNTRLAQLYMPGDATTTIKELMERARVQHLPPRVVPEWAWVVTLYADTQPTRLEVEVKAWGPGTECATLDHQILWGDPTDPPDQEGSVWQRLDEMRRTPLLHALGVLIYPSLYGIDSGGHNTQDVYNYGAARRHLGCVVTKGHSQANKPIIAALPSKQDIDYHGKKVEKGVELWFIGTDTAKDHMWNRLKKDSGPGAFHFHRELGQEYFEQLTVERAVTEWRRGKRTRRYVKPKGARNEALDCVVGNLALAHHIGLHRWSAKDWADLRDKLLRSSLTPDMFAQPAQAMLETPAVPAATPAPVPATKAAEGATAPAVAATPPAPSPLAAAPPVAMPPGPLLPFHPPAPQGRRVFSRGVR